MTDRSSTESKTSRFLETSKHIETHHFKCAVHPLLQFSDVCRKEILKYENDIELDTSDPKILTLLKFISKLFFIKMDLVILCMHQHIFGDKGYHLYQL